MSNIGISINEIVEDLLIQEDRNTSHKKKKYQHLAVNGLRELSYDLNGYIKYVKLDVNTSNNTVDLPSDFIKEVGVGVINSDGNFISLSRNNKIFKDKDDCGNTINPVSRANSNDFYYGGAVGNDIAQHWRNGQATGKYYGNQPSQSTGDYKINKQYGVIELSTNTSQASIILKYLADVEMINGDFLVHPFLREPLKNYIYWQDKAFSSSISPSEKRELKRLYVQSKNWARMRFFSFNYDEAREIARASFFQAPKY